MLFILESSEQAKAAIGKRITVVGYPDGRLAICYRGVELAYRIFDKIQQVDQGARLSRTSGSAPRSPSSATSSCAAINPTLACSRSAKLFYEPNGLSPLGKNTGSGFACSYSRAPVGRCATPEASRPPAA